MPIMTHRPRSIQPPTASTAGTMNQAVIRNAMTAAIVSGFILLTWVVVVQARTIETQRDLIRNLFADSGELRALREAQAARKNTPAGNGPTAQLPATATPAPQGKASAPGHAAADPPKLERQGRRKLYFILPPSPPRKSVPSPDARRGSDSA